MVSWPCDTDGASTSAQKAFRAAQAVASRVDFSLSEHKRIAKAAENDARGVRESARHIGEDRHRLKEQLSVAQVRRELSSPSHLRRMLKHGASNLLRPLRGHRWRRRNSIKEHR